MVPGLQIDADGERKDEKNMMTWQIMMGAQFISMFVSAAVVIAFMLKKEPLDVAAEKPADRIKVQVGNAMA